MVPLTVSTDPVYSQGFSTDNAGGWKGTGREDLVDSNICDTYMSCACMAASIAMVICAHSPHLIEPLHKGSP